MDRPPPLERLATWLRNRPIAVDVAIAGAVFLLSLWIGQTYVYGGDAGVISFLLCLPLVWRRHAPIPAAAAGVAAGLLEVLLVDRFLPANIAALLMVHALAAYAPRWAGRAGLAVGLAGAVLAGARPAER